MEEEEGGGALLCFAIRPFILPGSGCSHQMHELTAVLTQDPANILFEVLCTRVQGRERCLENQGLVRGVHEKDVLVVLLDFGARRLGSELPHGDELLPAQTPAAQGPHVQHSDIHTVPLRGRVPRRGLHLALDHHGRFVDLVLQGIQTRGVAGE